MWHRVRIELLSYQWMASTLTTPPSLLDRIYTTEQYAIFGNQGGARLVGTPFSFQYVRSNSSNVLKCDQMDRAFLRCMFQRHASR